MDQHSIYPFNVMAFHKNSNRRRHIIEYLKKWFTIRGAHRAFIEFHHEIFKDYKKYHTILQEEFKLSYEYAHQLAGKTLKNTFYNKFLHDSHFLFFATNLC